MSEHSTILPKNSLFLLRILTENLPKILILHTAQDLPGRGN
jgi:hypothetical protein